MPQLDDFTPKGGSSNLSLSSTDWVNGWSGGIIGSKIFTSSYNSLYRNLLFVNKSNNTITKTYNNLTVGDNLNIDLSYHSVGMASNIVNTSNISITYTQGTSQTIRQYPRPAILNGAAPFVSSKISDKIKITDPNVSISITFTNITPYGLTNTADLRPANSNPFFLKGIDSYTYSNYEPIVPSSITLKNKGLYYYSEYNFPSYNINSSDLPYILTIYNTKGLKCTVTGLKPNEYYTVLSYLSFVGNATSGNVNFNLSYKIRSTNGDIILTSPDNSLYYPVTFGPVPGNGTVIIDIDLGPTSGYLIPKTSTRYLPVSGVVVNQLFDDNNYAPSLPIPFIRVYSTPYEPPTITPNFWTGYNNNPPRNTFGAIIKPGDSISRAPWDYYGVRQDSLGVITGIFKDRDGDIVALVPTPAVCAPNKTSIGDLVFRPSTYDSDNNNYAFVGWPDNKDQLQRLPYFGTIKHSIPYVKINLENPNTNPAFLKLNAEGISTCTDFTTVKIHPYFLKYNLVDPRYDGNYIKSDNQGNILPTAFTPLLNSVSSTSKWVGAVSGGYLSSKFGIDRYSQFLSDGVVFSTYTSIPTTYKPIASGPLFQDLLPSRQTLRLQHILAWGNAIPITAYGRTIKKGYHTFVIGAARAKPLPGASQEEIDQYLFLMNPPYSTSRIEPQLVVGQYNHTVINAVDERANNPLNFIDIARNSSSYFIESIIPYTSSIDDLYNFVPSYGLGNGNNGAMLLGQDNGPFVGAYPDQSVKNTGCLQAIYYYNLKVFKL